MNDGNPTVEEDEAALLANNQMAEAIDQGTSAPAEYSSIAEVKAVQLLLETVADLPDTVDGLDLRQFKRMATISGQTFQNNLTAVLKLGVSAT